MTPERLVEIEKRAEAGTHKSQFITHARTDVPDLLAEVKRLRLISVRLYDVATFALPHIYEGLCPDLEQPDERDPSCDACKALIDPTEGDRDD